MKSRLQSLFSWLLIGLPKSLERQIMLFGASCLVITILGYGSYVAHMQTKAAKESISAQMKALAQNLATVDAHFLQTNETASIEVLTLQTATVPGIFSILVTDTSGKPLTEVVNKNGHWSPRYFVAPVKVPDIHGPKTVFETRAYDSSHRDFLAGQAGTLSAWHRIEADQPLGWVRVSYRLDEFDLISANIRAQSYKVMALAIAVMLLLLTLLLRQPLRALREATEFANTLDNTQGNTLEVSHRTLEIESLGKALNAVSARLSTQITDINNQKFALDQHAIVSITDLNGIITYANQRFCDISGFSQAELIGQNHRIVKSDEHPPELFEEMWHTITQGKTWNGDVKNRKKDGSFYWVNATIVPLVGSDGLPHHYIGIRTDITANKLLEQHLQSARDEAEAATQAKARFLANMSHEIRTPMNAILGMLKLIQNTELDKRQQDYASKAEGAAQSLLGLINDILDFSKIDAGKMTLETRNFRLDKLMRDLSVIVSSNLGTKPVEVLFDIDPAAPKALMGDALRLQQVLINLASNAIKFTSRGEVVISITQMEHTSTHTCLRFAVRDSGIGIAPEHQQHIFSGFSQAETSTTRRFGGTGLGLSISRKLVTLMGGNLELQSTPGHGSTFSFTITLPIAIDSAPKALPMPANNLQVLVVDDNASAREILTSMTESLGWKADTAENGAAAVALLQARVAANQPLYQAIFIDWQMPGMDGWETMKQLESINMDSHPPVVVMVTAHGRDMLNQRSPQEQARLHGFLVKPVTASMLLDAVADALSNRSQPKSTAAPVAKVKPLQGMRLLVVEDNIINQQVALEMLRGEGAQVSLADNGQLGVNAVQQAHATGQPFDAVLMDIQMPVMDGYNATRLLRQDPTLANLPIIAMTANAMASDREACLAVGMNEHVGKPFNLVQLVDLLQKLVQQANKLSTAANAGTAKANARVVSAPPEPALPPKDAIDVAAALERLGGNEALYVQVLKTYLNDLATQPEQLELSLKQADLATASRLLHTLKGLSATVGANYMAAVARKAELVLKAAQADADKATHLDQYSLCTEFRAAVHSTQHVLESVVHTYMSPELAQPVSIQPTRQLTEQDLTLLATLQSLLKASDMQAMTVFDTLQKSASFTDQPHLDELVSAITSLNFPEAAKVCEKMIGSGI